MNIYDHITEDDVSQLAADEYHAFRMYLRFLGYNVDNSFGDFRFATQSSKRFILILMPSGELCWCVANSVMGSRGTRIPLEEVKRMAALGMVV